MTKELIEALIERQNLRGLNGTEMAKVLGISQSYYSLLIKYKKRPDATALGAICKEFPDPEMVSTVIKYLISRASK
jgi:transcriptional regulator with XRE-family HTH domain